MDLSVLQIELLYKPLIVIAISVSCAGAFQKCSLESANADLKSIGDKIAETSAGNAGNKLQSPMPNRPMHAAILPYPPNHLRREVIVFSSFDVTANDAGQQEVVFRSMQGGSVRAPLEHVEWGGR